MISFILNANARIVELENLNVKEIKETQCENITAHSILVKSIFTLVL